MLSNLTNYGDFLNNYRFFDYISLSCEVYFNFYIICAVIFIRIFLLTSILNDLLMRSINLNKNRQK
jgi:hypothetical protein